MDEYGTEYWFTLAGTTKAGQIYRFERNFVKPDIPGYCWMGPFESEKFCRRCMEVYFKDLLQAERERMKSFEWNMQETIAQISAMELRDFTYLNDVPK